MNLVYKKPNSLTDAVMHYCPGCSHGVIHRIIAEIIDEMDIAKDTVCAVGVGCSCFIYDYFDLDVSATAHGRAPAVATGIKRVQPERLVFTYQGDGDLCAIGCSEAVHAAVRGENITVIMVNNGIYGMTGGQMAPTTLIGQKASTAPYGRKVENAGYPIKMLEMLSVQKGCAYAVRTKINGIKSINETKAAIRKAFNVQLNKKGFSIVEVMGTCPTNWGMDPLKALDWMEDNMLKEYPLGVIKDLKENE